MFAIIYKGPKHNINIAIAILAAKYEMDYQQCLGPKCNINVISTAVLY